MSPRYMLSRLLLILLYSMALNTAAEGSVGRTPGTFAVSPGGAATYTIPIWAPRGPNGLEPSIALTYNSNQGNGYLGVGWSMSGLSAIYRCNQTFAQDGAPAPVALSSSDAFCMDGRRLRLTSGTYGLANSTYQTEVTTFSNITAYGSAGNGPAYFIVQGRDGRTYTYGNAGNSRVLASGSATALSWQLNEVSDRAGNTMTIAYSTSNASGTVVPQAISWTPTSFGANTYAYTMQFAYGANVPQSSFYGYRAGTPVTNTNLLASITITYSGSTVKKYVLSYQASPVTNRDELTTIQECADAGATNCLNPTTVTYQSGSAGVGGALNLGDTAGQVQKVYTTYDLNGDGIPDLAWYDNNGWSVSFGSASGYSTPIQTGITTFGVIDDINGGGIDCFLVPLNGAWWIYKWNGSSFAGSSTGIAVDETASGTFALADVNGDGLPDLVTTGTDGYLYVRLNTSSTGSVSFASTAVKTIQNVYRSIWANPGGTRRLDFYGSGQQDLMGYYVAGNQGSVVLLHFSSSTFSAVGVGISSVPVDFADFNDDGCTDLLTVTELLISPCQGAPGALISFSGSAIAALDWDGDGRRDVLVTNGSTVSVYLSTGTGLDLSHPVATSLPMTPVTYYSVRNATGGGQDALLSFGYQSPYAVQYYLHSGSGQIPDLLTSVTDGYGNSVSPTYVALPQSVDATYFPWNDAQYPYQNYMGPQYLVNRAVFSDPSSASGGTYYQSYFYAGLWLNLQGRGLSPFGNLQTYDSRNGVWDTLGYQRAFPYTGIVSAHVRAANNQNTANLLGASVSLTDTVLSNTPYQQIHFPYISGQTVQNYELGNRLVDTTSTSYSYDNYGNATNITQTVTDNDTGSPYYNQSWTTAITNTPDPNPGTSCLNLLTQTQVLYTDSNNDTPVTRTKQFTPDLTNCRYTEIVTEPSSSLYKVTEDLGYDSFGNLDSDKITGIGMTPRTTTITWSNSTYTTGQLPLSATDASGATTQFAYNYSFGVPSGVTDPNGETTGWQYADGFGRKTEETRPNGTYTTWNYLDCTLNGNDCVLGSHTLQIDHYDMKSDGSALSSGSTFFDALERQFLKNDYLIGGGHDRYELRYDNLGHVQKQAIPCVWSAVTTPCPDWTTFSYDVLNRLTQAQRPISATNGTLQTTGYQYAGDTTTITDPQNNARTLIADPNGWRRETKDAYGYAVTLAYDAAGAKTSVTDSLGNTLWRVTQPYAYGIQPFLLGFTDMDRGSWGFTPDALGEQVAWTDAKGQHFSETYDALSRPLTRSEPDLFTQWTWGSTPSAHNVGMLQSVCTGLGSNPGNCSSSPGLSESRAYDADARLSQRTINLPAGGGSYTYTWQYEATSGLLDTLTYPVTTSGYAFKVQYGYSWGILAAVTDISDTPNVTLWQANTQNPAGQITQETLGNGIVVNRTFDAVTHWLGSIQAGVGGGAAVQNQSFLYDEMGNVTQRQDNNLGLTENAYYDNDYRLTSTKLNGAQNLSITYDNTMGNITARSDVAGNAAWTYSTTQKHAVTQAGSSAYAYAYDPNGNMSSHQGQTIQWSSYNYPTTISAGSGSTAESVSLAYGPDRQRWQQIYTGNGTSETTDYIGGLMDMVSSGSTVDYRHYVYAGGEPVAVYSRKSSGVNTFSYMLSDHQSSTAKITNSSGGVVVSESFTPSGNRRNPATWSGSASTSDLTTAAGITRQGYTFQTQLGLWMGLNHMNGRVQDAIIGRFISADPIGTDDNNSQSFNRYSYVGNNPLSLVDPTGFSGHDPDTADPGGDLAYGPSPDDPFPPCDSSGLSCVTIGFTPCPNCYQICPTCYFTPGSPGWRLGANTPPSRTIIPCRTGTDCFLPTQTQGDPCPSVNPPSKSNMTPVPFTDDHGNPILNPDGTPMMRPAGIDPHSYTQAGAADAAQWGPGTFDINSLANFRIGGPWDAQRAAGQWYPEFRSFANVALGLYAGADGLTSDQMNAVGNLYASRNSNFTGQNMDSQFTHLPAANVDNTDLGVSLATVGNGFGICTPAAGAGAGK